jgi:hypothetical protein
MSASALGAMSFVCICRKADRIERCLASLSALYLCAYGNILSLDISKSI